MVRWQRRHSSPPEDEILKVLEFGVPNSWQKRFVMHQFDPQAHSVMEFIEFCKRIEATEDPPEACKNNDKAQDTSKGNTKNPDKHKGKRKFNNDKNGNSQQVVSCPWSWPRL